MKTKRLKAINAARRGQWKRYADHLRESARQESAKTAKGAVLARFLKVHQR